MQVEASRRRRGRPARRCRAAGRPRRSCPGRRRSPGRSRPAPASAARRARRAPAGSRSGPRSRRSPAAGTCARAPAPVSPTRPGERARRSRRAPRACACRRASRRGGAARRGRRRRRRRVSRLARYSQRDAQVVDRAEDVVGVGLVAVGLERRDDRGQRRHVPDHRQRAELRVQRQRDAPAHREVVDRRAPRGVDPVARGCRRARAAAWTSGSSGSRNTSRCAASRSRSSGTEAASCDAVGVVEHEAEVADAPDAGLRADRRLADLDARVAERALLGLAGAVVEVDLLVRAARDAVAPAAAAVLVDEDDAVLLALVHRARRARGDARRVQAVLADPRQEEHERLLVGQADLLLHARQVRVASARAPGRRPAPRPSWAPT